MPDMPLTDLSDTEVMVVARLTLAAKSLRDAAVKLGLELDMAQVAALALAAIAGFNRIDPPDIESLGRGLPPFGVTG